MADIYPERIPDLFSAKPIVITGRFTGAARGVVRLKGKMLGREFMREIPVEFPESQTQHDVLASLWARIRVDQLMGQDYTGIQRGNMRDDLKETITQLGLEYRLMTQFTSFVAVEEMIVTEGGKPRRIDVPVEVPEGVNREGVFGVPGLVQLHGGSTGYLAPMALGRSPGRVVTKSGTNVSESAGSGIGVGRGAGVGGNLGGGTGRRAGGSAPKPTGTPSRDVAILADVQIQSLTPEEQWRTELSAKVHPSILAVIERLKEKRHPDSDESKFIRDGKAEVQIWLNEKSDDTLAKLKELGFEIVLDPKSAKLVIGKIPIEKLEELTALKAVRYVAPQLFG